MVCAAVKHPACAGQILICGPGVSRHQARVLVGYPVRIEEPEYRNGKRMLPLDGELVAALIALRRRQLEESTVFHWVHEYASA